MVMMVWWKSKIISLIKLQNLIIYCIIFYNTLTNRDGKRERERGWKGLTERGREDGGVGLRMEAENTKWVSERKCWMNWGFVGFIGKVLKRKDLFYFTNPLNSTDPQIRYSHRPNPPTISILCILFSFRVRVNYYGYLSPYFYVQTYFKNQNFKILLPLSQNK
jgi:hypothetical protein